MKSTPDSPKIVDGLVQLVRMDKSTWLIWVKCNALKDSRSGLIIRELYDTIELPTKNRHDFKLGENEQKS